MLPEVTYLDSGGGGGGMAIRQVNRMYLPFGLPQWESGWFIHAQVTYAPYELNWDKEIKKCYHPHGHYFAI